MKTVNFTLADAAVIANTVCAEHNSIIVVAALKKALAKFGITNVQPIFVKVLVFNPYVTKEFTPKGSPSKKRLTALLKHPRGHSFILGQDTSDKSQIHNMYRTPSHSVLLVKNSEGTWLMDASLPYSNDVEHNIRLSPMVFKVDENFETIGSRAVVRENSCAIIYNSVDDKSNEDFLSWIDKDSNLVNQLANQIFEHIISGTQ